VQTGVALAALLYIRRVTETTSVSCVTREYLDEGQSHALQGKDIPPYVTILRIHGPFLFGMTDKLVEATDDLNGFGEIVILRLRNMTAIDATGLHAIENLSDRLRASGRTLVVCGARRQPASFLAKSEFVDHVGRDNVVEHVAAALARAIQIHEQPRAA
jgi:SulP family sulfate permease